MTHILDVMDYKVNRCTSINTRFYDIKYEEIIFSLKTNLFLKDITSSYLNYRNDTDYHQHCIS